MQTWLILGGARSGKSRRALNLAEAQAGDLVYVATAQAKDAEMAERIARHKAERDTRWRTEEAPLALANVIGREAGPERIVVVDCLTLWLSNLMLAGLDVDQQIDGLVARIHEAKGPMIFVSNEVGLGLVPETALGRAFRDQQGRLNQAVAAACQRVEMIIAGLPITLKG